MNKVFIKTKDVIVKVLRYVLYAIIGVVIVYYVADEMFISKQEIEDSKYARQMFPDGEYVADVQYINLCTGHKNYYELVVMLEGDSLVRINFENGGYLDESHISPLKMETDKYVDIKDRDGCKIYSVKILHQN